MLTILAERKRRLELLLTLLSHPSSTIKLKLFALKSMGKIPYFRFRKRDHTDPYLSGYRPQLKAFNRELLSTFIAAQQGMADLLESGKLTGKEYLLVLEQLAKLAIPTLRMQDHCDNPLPAIPAPSAPSIPSPTQAQLGELEELDPAEQPDQAAEASKPAGPTNNTDAPAPTNPPNSKIVQNVQNGQISQIAAAATLSSDSHSDSDLTLAHC